MRFLLTVIGQFPPFAVAVTRSFERQFRPVNGLLRFTTDAL